MNTESPIYHYLLHVVFPKLVYLRGASLIFLIFMLHAFMFGFFLFGKLFDILDLWELFGYLGYFGYLVSCLVLDSVNCF